MITKEKLGGNSDALDDLLKDIWRGEGGPILPEEPAQVESSPRSSNRLTQETTDREKLVHLQESLNSELPEAPPPRDTHKLHWLHIKRYKLRTIRFRRR